MVVCVKRMLASGGFVGAIVLVVVLILLMTSEQASGQTMNEIIIRITETSGEVDVEPGNPTNGMFYMNGTVRIKNQTDPHIVVTQTISAGGWPSNIHPGGFDFWAHERENRVKPFAVRIRAPIGYSTKVSQNVILGGSWQGSEGLVGDLDQKSFIIFVKQYFAAMIEAPELHLTDGGKQVSIPISLWNTGNGVDEFSFRIENRRFLEKKGWTIGRTEPVVIEEKMNTNFKINARAPEEAGTYEFVFNVTSLGSIERGDNYTRYFLKVFHVKVEVDKTLEISLMLIGGSAAVTTAVFWRWRKGSWSYA